MSIKLTASFQAPASLVRAMCELLEFSHAVKYARALDKLSYQVADKQKRSVAEMATLQEGSLIQRVYDMLDKYDPSQLDTLFADALRKGEALMLERRKERLLALDARSDIFGYLAA